jgi:hypothetical protein
MSKQNQTIDYENNLSMPETVLLSTVCAVCSCKYTRLVLSSFSVTLKLLLKLQKTWC